jgi:hypothetical protein
MDGAKKLNNSNLFPQQPNNKEKAKLVFLKLDHDSSEHETEMKEVEIVTQEEPDSNSTVSASVHPPLFDSVRAHTNKQRILNNSSHPFDGNNIEKGNATVFTNPISNAPLFNSVITSTGPGANDEGFPVQYEVQK